MLQSETHQPKEVGHITRRRGTHQPKAQWDTSAELAQEMRADGRIRTGDPLFTKQLLCQLSYVGVRPELYERLRGKCRDDARSYEVATVVCAGSSGLIVIKLTGWVSLTNVVTKVDRDGSHHVIR
jgi:hypothetical protein